MADINVGLIGFGNWPRVAYAPVLTELQGVTVRALAARSEATRQLAIEAFGDQLQCHNDYASILNDPQIDAVMLALPNHMHAEVIAATIAADKHLFYEPPAALDEASIEKALSAMSQTDRVVQVDLELRHLPVIGEVRQLLADGQIGKALMAKISLWCNWGHGGGEWYDEVQGQDFFLWLGCWYLDALDCVFDAAPVSANVVGGYTSNGTLMDHGWATLAYPDDRIGQYEFNLVATTDAKITLNVAGTEGEIEADIQSGDYRWRKEGNQWQQMSAPASGPAAGFEGMRESICDFFDAIANGRAPKADLAVSRRVHQAAVACMRAANQ